MIFEPYFEVVEDKEEPIYNEVTKTCEPQFSERNILFSSSSEKECEQWMKDHKGEYESSWTHIIETDFGE
jgi:hypothetical protein